MNLNQIHQYHVMFLFMNYNLPLINKKVNACIYVIDIRTFFVILAEDEERHL